MELSEIKIIENKNLKKKPEGLKTGDLGFGMLFTDYLFTIRYDPDKGGWHNPQIEPFADIPTHPAAVVFHYAQTIFEGQKAYLRDDGKISMFRPQMNIARFNRSAERLCMPTLDEKFLLEAFKMQIALEKEWVPSAPDCSLYIRPTMIGTSGRLGVQPATSYLFFNVLSPVGAYFKSGLKPVRIMISRHYVRAVRGGMGDAKTGGNYATSLLAGSIGKKRDCAQVLWLDAIHNKYVEEMGGMNAFFVIDDVLTTAPLTGTILPGVTRDSIIQIAKDKGWRVKERLFSIDEVIEGIKKGRVKEAFASGTAAVVTPVKELYDEDGTIYHISDETGYYSRELYKTLTDIQYGRVEDKYGWNVMVT
ncbi:MAG: branched-chain amino acid aminotransferase [Myxococcota bacterium]